MGSARIVTIKNCQRTGIIAIGITFPTNPLIQGELQGEVVVLVIEFGTNLLSRRWSIEK